MPNIIPKSSTYITIAAGFVIIGVVCAIYGSNFTAQFHRFGFVLGFIFGVAAMTATAIYWLISLKDPAYEYFSGRMWPYVLAFAFLAAWCFGWSSQYKVDKEDHINYEGKK